jgi:hypothetical protein
VKDFVSLLQSKLSLADKEPEGKAESVLDDQDQQKTVEGEEVQVEVRNRSETEIERDQ